MNDVEALVQNANNINISRFMTDAFPNPYRTEDAIRFIHFATTDNPVHIFAIEIDEEAAGGIGIHPQSDVLRKNAELGYWLAEKHWGNGIITAAIPQMIEYGFKSFDITRIYARPFGNNPASQRVLEKCGFKLEARIEKNLYKNGEFLDELIYAVRL
jgi:ribosomal-protein-alanine N-acetyltransferase